MSSKSLWGGNMDAPLPALSEPEASRMGLRKGRGKCAECAASANNSPHGVTASISSRSCSRQVFFVCRWNSARWTNFICRMCDRSPRSTLTTDLVDRRVLRKFRKVRGGQLEVRGCQEKPDPLRLLRAGWALRRETVAGMFSSLLVNPLVSGCIAYCWLRGGSCDL
jgi:hypothetical protein